MGEQHDKQAPAVPEPEKQDGTGGEEESGAGYGNNAGYQGEREKPASEADE